MLAGMIPASDVSCVLLHVEWEEGWNCACAGLYLVAPSDVYVALSGNESADGYLLTIAEDAFDEQFMQGQYFRADDPLLSHYDVHGLACYVEDHYLVLEEDD